MRESAPRPQPRPATLSCPRIGNGFRNSMSITSDWKRDLLRTLFARPDEVMLDLGAGGELLVARVRALMSALTLLLPPLALIGNLGAGSTTELMIGLGASIFINIFAQIWLALDRKSTRLNSSHVD